MYPLFTKSRGSRVGVTSWPRACFSVENKMARAAQAAAFTCFKQNPQLAAARNELRLTHSSWPNGDRGRQGRLTDLAQNQWPQLVCTGLATSVERQIGHSPPGCLASLPGAASPAPVAVPSEPAAVAVPSCQMRGVSWELRLVWLANQKQGGLI